MSHSPSSTRPVGQESRTNAALYIHWPFCVAKCPYCDFNSHVRDQIDTELWLTSLVFDLRHEHSVNPDVRLGSIFFGGGTPSLMPPQLVARLIWEADRLWGFTADCEITLEANPSSVEAARFADLAQAGVNRVSLGLQSLDDETLRFLGRAHDVAEGLMALEIAQREFDRVSFDLIYARPGQSAANWETELARSLAFGTDHLSLYQLTIEPGTRFETLVRKGELIPADDDHCADLFEMTQEMTAAAGLPAYEISNHARPGQESRHNLAYWHYDDYFGVGPGAHGRRLNIATERHRKPENFLSAVERNGNGLQVEKPLDPNVRASEALMMGLRLTAGIDLDGLEKKTGLDRSDMINMQAINHLRDLGLISARTDRLCVTPRGLPLLDALLPEIII